MQSTNRQAALSPRRLDCREELAEAGSVLLIEAQEAMSFLLPRPGVQTVVITHRRLLSAGMIQTVRPDVVVAPLIAAKWDLVELADTLVGYGYRGSIFALTKPLPRGELILSELSGLYPPLDFRLLEVA